MFQRCRTGLLLVVAAATVAHAQAPGPISSRPGYFGSPVLKVTRLRNQSAIMLGGRGAWNLTPSLAIGGGLYGTWSRVDAPVGATSVAGDPLDIKLEAFGLEVEYARNPGAPTHLTFGAFFGGAANRYLRDGTSEQDGETDFMFLLEPAIGAERRIARSVHLHVAASYRLVEGVDQRALSDSDFNGPALVVGLKLGRF